MAMPTFRAIFAVTPGGTAIVVSQRRDIGFAAITSIRLTLGCSAATSAEEFGSWGEARAAYCGPARTTPFSWEYDQDRGQPGMDDVASWVVDCVRQGTDLNVRHFAPLLEALGGHGQKIDEVFAAQRRAEEECRARVDHIDRSLSELAPMF